MTRLTTCSLVLTLTIFAVACDDDDAEEFGFFVQDNLVSDSPALAATVDPLLIDPWGLAAGDDTFLWVANRGTGTATAYDGDGRIAVFAENGVAGDQVVVEIPPPFGAAPGVTARPTDVVFNPTSEFDIEVGEESESSTVVFATEGGLIAGWSGDDPDIDPTLAFPLVDATGSAVYTGLAIDSSRLGLRANLYAANFLTGEVEVFEGDLDIEDDLERDPFIDAAVPLDLIPFGVAVIGDEIYVSYALPLDSSALPDFGAGLGAISVFERDGEFERTLVVGGPLDAPFGMVRAPDDFGPFSDEILVSNMGDGTISAFDDDTGRFLGTLRDETGAPIVIEGLRDIQVGNDDLGPDSENHLFFSAVTEDGGGLVGRLHFVVTR